jgi:tripartite ATP-independent transporter DctP family solute receptor
MKRLAITLLVCVLALARAASGDAGMTLKYGLVAPPTHPNYLGAKAFAEHIQAKTHGEITVDVFPMGQLGGERSMVEQVQGGTLDIADCTTGVLSNFVPEVALFDLPFLWPSRKVAYAVTLDPEFWKIFADLFPKKGFAAIGYGENEFRDLTNTKREVRKPEDLKGLKIRVIEAPIFLDTWRALGASPVPMPFPEIYNALQQGVIDAQENPLMTSVMMKFTEVTPFATITNYSLTECIKVINLDLWQRLTPDQQAIFREASAVMIALNREENVKQTEEIVSKLEQQGKVKITRLTAEERRAFYQAVQPVYAEYEQKVGTIPNKSEYGRFAGMTYLKMIQEKIKQYQ